MNLMVADSARKKIAPLLGPHTRVLLSLDDGVGPYSHHGLVALEVDFMLVIIRDDMPFEDYNTPIETNMGTWYAKDYSVRQLGQNMTLSLQPTYNTLQLKADGEMIDDSIGIEDLTGQK
ncbi:iron-sulfur cluster biosynthesis family protein [Levilactobacillus bambusae]|uniref:Iron-sulfur cluster biosynthesis family protein n=1 Tax=Levilactobacillus bambusae TaxID=2024736 RepID=A0A2V1N0E0_9LACO|nr:iron-sulfur cluster biosynthesis family protein [Levilactobacillus bambusae]PWG00532.1 iron-sulfur cluster biosynthesis family protein [Levilactobacillus bambusae]